jgi:beta-glucosidase
MVQKMTRFKHGCTVLLLALCLTTVYGVPPGACRTSRTKSLPFCDTSLAFQERVTDLVKRLNLAEKIGLLSSVHDTIPRLDVPAYDFGNECLHGTRVVGGTLPASVSEKGATVFPQPLGMAATFDTDLISLVGNAISDESRAISNVGGSTKPGVPGFLDCWAPNVNIFRDPRWGRGSETYGEDPTLTSKMLHAFVVGIQVGIPASKTKFVKVMSVLKHFVAYSLEEADGEMRFYFDAKTTDQDMEDTYLPAFKVGVQDAKARGIMCSYNAVNSKPMCGNAELLTGTLRKNWSYTGHVVSDCSAVGNIYDPAGYTDDLPSASAMALKAGTDMNCGSAYAASMQQAVDKKMVAEEDINTAISRSLLGRFEVGQFDPPEDNPFTAIPLEVVGSPKHFQIAREVARKSIVLLKNDDGVLPLSNSSQKTIAVIGPNANDTLVLLGNYHGRPAFGKVTTPLMAMQDRMGKEKDILYAPGVNVVSGDGAWGFDPAIDAARKADVAVLFLGSSSKGTVEGVTHLDTIEKESMDRRTLGLPGLQSDLVKALTKHSTCDIVVVLINGGPIAIEDLLTNPRVKGILQAWYPGQNGGDAVVDILSGDYSPSGKLPVTIYAANYTDQIKATDMGMRRFPGRTYRYLQVPPLFPFGYGMSYAEFRYLSMSLSTTILRRGNDSVSVSLECKNLGTVTSDEVVLLFVSFEATSGDISRLGTISNKDLRRFQRLTAVKPSEVRTVSFQLTRKDFELSTLSGSPEVVKGLWHIEIGVGNGKIRAAIKVEA